MTVDDLMRLFAEEFGLGRLRPNGEGAYHLDFDGMTVAFRETEGGARLLVLGEVGELPEEGADIFCRVLLKAMFPGGALAEGGFALNPETDRLFLQRQTPLADLDFDRFKTAVESFVNELANWRQALEAFRPAAEEIGRDRDRAEAEAKEIMSQGFMRV